METLLNGDHLPSVIRQEEDHDHQTRSRRSVPIDIATCPFMKNAKMATHCDPQSPYRTIDGSCNNLNNITMGKSFIPLSRYLQSDYADGKSYCWHLYVYDLFIH